MEEKTIEGLEKFKELGISDVLLRALKAHKIEKPTEVQEKAIPFALEGRDIIAGAATGSGKTLAFGSAIMQNSEPGAGLQALVLVPTRELAIQVADSLGAFGIYKDLNVRAIYGGVSIALQFKQIIRADVVVGTPGRILDHLERNSIDLSEIKILVLDEADRMLDMGFLRDVERIINNCSKERQTMLFSATINQEVTRLSSRYMKNPVEVSAEEQVDPSKLRQIYYDVPDSQKFSLLYTLLKKENKGLIMIFCNTQRNTSFVAKNLIKRKINAVAIHGGLSQNQRTNIMKMFHSKIVPVLVCTDVASRGLDIKGVTHVYNYDVPNEINNYVHRIGRTARAGADGVAITILASRDYEQFGRLSNFLEVKIENAVLPEIENVPIMVEERGRDKFSRFRNRRRGCHGDVYDKRDARSRNRGERKSRKRIRSRDRGRVQRRERRFNRRG